MCSVQLEDGCFPMQDLPYGTVIEVIKRMDTAAFFAIQRTSKWLYRAVEANRHKFIKNVNNEDFTLQYQHVKDLDLPALKDYFLGDKRHFCYHMISIRSFRDNANELRRVLSIFKNARIYADIINVDTSAIVPEIFDYFKPKNYSFNLCKKMLPVATETYPTGPFGLIIGRAVNPKAFEDCLLALADKSERFDLTALNVDLKIEPLKRYMATLGRLRSRQAFSLSMTRPLPVDGFNSPDENFYKFAFNTRGKEGKLLTLIIYNSQGERVAGCYYSDNLHNRVEFFCAHVASFLEFEKKILGTFAKKATLLKYDRNRISQIIRPFYQ